jgi:hypothetical protein
MKSLTRLVLVASALALPLGGCASVGDALDPTEWFAGDFFNTKKKLPGDRKPVFPEGVPGVAQGIPSDLVKGNQQAAYTADPQTTSATQQSAAQPEEFRPAPREEPKAKRKAQPKSATAERPAAKTERAPTAVTVRRPPEAQPQQRQQQQQEQADGATQWPEPPPPRTARPSGGVQWPDPPAMR